MFGTRHLPTRRSKSGFTLIEVMVVVVIVGVLATLGTYGVRNYLLSAKTSEAISMMTTIKTAEEAYKAETFVYLDVSTSFNVGNFHPTSAPTNTKFNWRLATDTNASRNFRTLGVEPDGPVYFTYAVVATAPGAAAPSLPTTKTLAQFGLPSSPDRWQYIAVAMGNLDGSSGSASRNTYVLSHSYSAEVYVENEGD
jgi:prepilin-type N-terminal cleavage/methylation domain-containing protein